MRVMGLGPVTYHMSHFIAVAPMMLLYATVITIVSCYIPKSGIYAIDTTEPGIVFIWLLIGFLNACPMAYFVASICNKGMLW